MLLILPALAGDPLLQAIESDLDPEVYHEDTAALYRQACTGRSSPDSVLGRPWDRQKLACDWEELDLELSCDEGSPHACWSLGRLEESCELGLLRACTELSIDDAEALSSLCELGEGRACLYLSESSDTPLPMLERACDLDDFACTGLAAQHRANEELEAARALYRSACEAGSLKGCAALSLFEAFGWGGEPEVVAASARLEKGCELGHPRSCHLLGWAAENGSVGFSRDLDLAEARYTQACTMGAVESCTALGLLLRPSDPKTSERIMLDACIAGDLTACNNQGIHYRQKGLSGRAEALFQHSCESGNPVGCGLLGQFYRDSALPLEAILLFRDACDGGVLRAAQLSVLAGGRLLLLGLVERLVPRWLWRLVSASSAAERAHLDARSVLPELLLVVRGGLVGGRAVLLVGLCDCGRTRNKTAEFKKKKVCAKQCGAGGKRS